MKFFYLSSIANGNGDFEIHDKECGSIPGSLDRDYLGPFNNCQEALRKAQSLNPKAVCCDSCCKTTFQAVINAKLGNR
ncbi:hypothetical protein J0A68_16455 [Algoriphagus sp. H41]|uniref:Uncharacterized protein n=1 Tax=Algoriphagus oliviformis TaxID=2811231 RepID=A0ABS3C613_9BACT|nr:hypothetical protein [Algoriphagus oliviformis]MBN7812548.1 hypothetical protein [Algoriphagus oliviformis]